MKQTVNAGAFVVIIGVVILVVAVAAMWVWRGPSATVDPNAKKGPPDLRNEQHGPGTDEVRQIQEWKKTHPDAATKY